LKVLCNLIKMKKDGLPIANSYACLQALKDNRWKCHPWMIASVDPDGKITQGCYVKNRGEISCEKCGFSAHTEISLAYSGEISCEKCGFSAHTEISLAYSGVIGSLRVGNTIFGPKKRKRIQAYGRD